MFLSALQSYAVAIIIAVIVVQYAFALFCLLKLAYFDIPKKQYILWNLFILIVVFIGCIVFLVYYYKHPEKRLDKNGATPVTEQPAEDNSDGAENDGQAAEATNADDTDSEITNEDK